MAAAQRPYAAAAFAATPSGPPAWKTLPCWYLLGTEDKAIPPALQRFMAERANATIVEVPASHVSFVSQPEAATQLILQAVEATVWFQPRRRGRSRPRRQPRTRCLGSKRQARGRAKGDWIDRVGGRNGEGGFEPPSRLTTANGFRDDPSGARNACSARFQALCGGVNGRVGQRRPSDPQQVAPATAPPVARATDDARA